MAKLYERKLEYRRDGVNRYGQQLMPWAAGRVVSSLQAADMFGVSDDMIRRMCETGELEAYRLRPRCKRSPWRIVTESLYTHFGKVIAEYGPGPSPAVSALPLSRVKPPLPTKK